MALRGITLSLSAAQLSDLYFNFEHPERDKLFWGKANAMADFSDEDLEKANLSDANEFAAVIGIPERFRSEFVAELIEDFKKRI